MNCKKLYRLSKKERLTGRKRALGPRAPMAIPQDANQRCSPDVVSDTLSQARRFRLLCVSDDFSEECPASVADNSLSGEQVARKLEAIAKRTARLSRHDRLGQRN